MTNREWLESLSDEEFRDWVISSHCGYNGLLKWLKEENKCADEYKKFREYIILKAGHKESEQ